METREDSKSHVMCVCVRLIHGYVNLDCTHKRICVNSVFEMSGFIQL